MKIALFGKTLAPENGEYMKQLFKELADNQTEIVVYQPFANIVPQPSRIINITGFFAIYSPSNFSD